MSHYMMLLKANLNYCLGIKNPSPGEQLVLMQTPGDPNQHTTWDLDSNTQRITLASTVLNTTPLTVDVTGGGSNTPITLQFAKVGRASQQWDWISTSSAIKNVQYPGMCIDNTYGVVAAGNPITLWPHGPGNNHQEWVLVSVNMVQSLMAELAAMREPAPTSAG